MASHYSTQRSNFIKQHGTKPDLRTPAKWGDTLNKLEQMLHELEDKHAKKVAEDDMLGANKVLEKIELLKGTISNHISQHKGK